MSQPTHHHEQQSRQINPVDAHIRKHFTGWQQFGKTYQRTGNAVTDYLRRTYPGTRPPAAMKETMFCS